jgi:membrane associated rhomboid family serine protease
MCRNCGSIVGAGQQECAVCSANIAGETESQKTRAAPDGETMRFARAVLNRPYKFTIVLLIANLFVFMLMWHSSGMSVSAFNFFPYEVLVAYGAKVNYLIREHHQWWRFITPMFIHVNLIHLLVNMYSLWVVGPYVEKLYGSAKFVVFWVVTGVAAVVASYLTVVSPGTRLGPLAAFLFKTADFPSAGASGALFGLVGVLFVFGIKFRHELPEGFKRAFGTGLLPMIMLNLVIGYLGRGLIDNAAHLGGLFAGAALALLVDYRRPGEKSGIAITWQILQIACIGLVIISFLKTTQHFRDPLPTPLLEQRDQMESEAQLPTNAGKFVAYADSMNEAQEAFNLALNRGDVTRVDEAVKKLDSVPELDPKADELRKKLKDFLLRAKTIETTSQDNMPQTKRIEAKRQLNAEFIDWIRDYGIWLKTTGRTYGLIEATETQPTPEPARP